ncbi:hypothetical protein, partial [Phenylobacterium haematophilum]|uniref:hypothetical protein n=1 Tax=Phenylobacterium haematophilum TaxID=98513 RepID=UPI001C843FB1
SMDAKVAGGSPAAEQAEESAALLQAPLRDRPPLGAVRLKHLHLDPQPHGLRLQSVALRRSRPQGRKLGGCAGKLLSEGDDVGFKGFDLPAVRTFYRRVRRSRFRRRGGRVEPHPNPAFIVAVAP